MTNARLNGPLKFFAVVLGVLLSSAVLAPPLSDVLPYPFARIFRRLLMIGSILGILILVRFRKDTFVRYGMAWTPDSARVVRLGFVSGFLGLMVFVLVSFVAGHASVAVRELTALQWVQRIATGLAAGVLIGVVEEFVLRGVVFSYARDSVFRGRVVPAMIAASLLYAALHFLNFRTPLISPDPGIADSARLILAPIRSLAGWQTMWPAAVGLFLFGMVLNACVVQTGSLYPAIGLHAGCVAFLRIARLFVGFGSTSPVLWGTKNVYDGAIGWAFLVLIGVVLTRLLKHARTAA